MSCPVVLMPTLIKSGLHYYLCTCNCLYIVCCSTYQNYSKVHRPLGTFFWNCITNTYLSVVWKLKNLHFSIFLPKFLKEDKYQNVYCLKIRWNAKREIFAFNTNCGKQKGATFFLEQLFVSVWKLCQAVLFILEYYYTVKWGSIFKPFLFTEDWYCYTKGITKKVTIESSIRYFCNFFLFTKNLDLP